MDISDVSWDSYMKPACILLQALNLEKNKKTVFFQVKFFILSQNDGRNSPAIKCWKINESWISYLHVVEVYSNFAHKVKGLTITYPAMFSRKIRIAAWKKTAEFPG